MMSQLLQRAIEVSARAKACGALVPIETDHDVVTDHDIDFVVRIARNLARKHSAATINGNGTNTPRPNPFLPYDQRLWVADSGPTHAILLNKFNVIDNHLLIVTRDYEHQNQLLTAADFAALAPLLENHGGLGFYNGGQQAGASQQHKHLQWIPGIDLRGELCIPIERALPRLDGGTWSLQHVPFPMALARLQQRPLAEQAWQFYRQMTRALAIDTGTQTASKPYNLLITPGHMWLVPRRQESFDAISLNAMAYAGSLFVKDATALQHLRQQGPLTALLSCAARI